MNPNEIAGAPAATRSPIGAPAPEGVWLSPRVGPDPGALRP